MGQLIGVLKQHLDITDKTIVVEVDGDTIDDFMYAAEAAYTLSEQVMIKVPTKRVGIQAHARLRDLGVRTMATTVFSLSQAVLVAAAGASWIAPFVGSNPCIRQRCHRICLRDCERVPGPTQRRRA